MVIIYYLFEDKIPTQDELELEGYDDVEDYIQNTLGDDDILNEIHGAYYCEINTSPTEFVGNDNLVIPKIKNDLNIDSTIDAKLFEEDTSYKHDDYMKLITNETILKNYLSFIVNLNEEFSKIQKEQIENASKKLPHIDQVNNAQNKKYNTFTKTRDEYINPVFQKCAIALIDIEADYKFDSIAFYDLNEFINLMINAVNYNQSATYYVHSKLCAVSEM